MAIPTFAADHAFSSCMGIARMQDIAVSAMLLMQLGEDLLYVKGPSSGWNRTEEIGIGFGRVWMLDDVFYDAAWSFLSLSTRKSTCPRWTSTAVSF